MYCDQCSYIISFDSSEEGELGKCDKCGSVQFLKNEPAKETVSAKKIQELATEKIKKTANEGKSNNIIFVPFVAKAKATISEQADGRGGRSGESKLDEIGNDLTRTAEAYEAQGYEFLRIETIHVDVSPGCIGALIGKGKEYHPFDYLVFKKSSSNEATED